MSLDASQILEMHSEENENEIISLPLKIFFTITVEVSKHKLVNK